MKRSINADHLSDPEEQAAIVALAHLGVTVRGLMALDTPLLAICCALMDGYSESALKLVREADKQRGDEARKMAEATVFELLATVGEYLTAQLRGETFQPVPPSSEPGKGTIN